MRPFLFGIPAGLTLAYLFDWAGLPQLRMYLAEFLLTPSFPTSSSYLAGQLPWQYGSQPDSNNLYWTSYLGVINGILPLFGIVLVVHSLNVDQEPKPILILPYLSFRKKWW